MHRRTLRPILVLGTMVCMCSALLGGCERDTSGQDDRTDAQATAQDFAGPDACARCHAGEHADWTRSHHYRAMMPAADSTVLGDFDDATFTADGVTSRFFRTAEGFFISTEGHDGRADTFAVRYTFGFSPLQQYLVEAPGGRMQVPRVSWDSEKGRWFHQYPGQRFHPHDWLHWTGAAQNWNAMCASCHSTHLDRGYDEATDTYRTTWAHMTVSCEACHGPGSAHIAYAEGEGYAKGERRPGSYMRMPRGADQRSIIAGCMPCHSRRSELTATFTGTDEPLDELLPALPVPDLYHADGQIRDEVYVYGSFLQSRMHRRWVKCTDCHQPHTGALLFEGNALCRQCHEAEYDSEAHTFHATGSEASQCVSCHMPTRTYMGNDVRHDHSFRVPRPDQSVLYGTPNACTACHTDRSDQWAADRVRERYGPDRPPHFSDRLLAGSRQDDGSLEALLSLYSDTATPDIIRATALHHLGLLGHPGALGALREGVRDPQALVRHSALQALTRFPPARWPAEVTGSLTDPVKAVRIEAARMLGMPSAAPPEVLRTDAFARALAEMLATLHLQSDMTTGSLMLADQYRMLGEGDKAETYYLRALRLDSLANYARINLAGLYNALGRNSDALRVLHEAIRIDPGNARLQYDMGLLLAEMGAREEASECLTEADRLGLDNERLYVNHGALLQQMGNMERAKAVYDRGLQRHPRSADLLADAAGMLLREGRAREAQGYMDRLRALAPHDPRLPALEELKRGVAARSH